MMKRFLLSLSFLLFIASPAMAYKQVVHRAITRNAWDRALAAMDLKSHLGVDATTTLEGRVPRDWAEQGADDEDNGTNSLDHFFDPRHDAPLTVRPFCNSVGSTAQQRALASGPLNDACLGTIDEDYREAVMGKSDNERREALKNLFQHLGHNIHLLQDMAQPEHTRNDQHLFPLFGNTPASIYEEWGLLHLIGLNPDISYEGFPTVVNDRYEPYFHTDDSVMGYPAGRGLADFSNNNFLTQDTNYHDELDPHRCYHYDLPILPPESAVRAETVDEYVWLDGFRVMMSVDEKIYTSSINDYVRNSTEADPFHTFFSSLDLETHEYGEEVYSLGDGSYTTRASMLVPRAVGYSAGMLQRIFRGSIKVDWTESPGGWTMTVTNTSSEAIGADAWIDVSYTDPAPLNLSIDQYWITGGRLADLLAGFNGIPAGGSVSIEGLTPPLPAGSKVTDFERRIAIQGTLGTSKAVIGLVQPPQRPRLMVGTRSGIKLVAADGSHSETIWPAPINWDAVFPDHSTQFWSPDGHSIVVWGLRGGQDQLSIARTIPPAGFEPLDIILPDGKACFPTSTPSFNPTGTKLAFWGQHVDCPAGDFSCATRTKTKQGVFVVDTLTGDGTFENFEDQYANAEWFQNPSGPTPRLSGNGRYFEYAHQRLDLFTHEVLAANYVPIGFIAPLYDGQKTVYVDRGLNLMIYNWFSGTSAVLYARTADTAISWTAPILLSPAGDKLAFVIKANTGEQKVMIYDLTTNTTAPATIGEPVDLMVWTTR